MDKDTFIHIEAETQRMSFFMRCFQMQFRHRKWMYIKFSLKFVTKGPIENNPALV